MTIKNKVETLISGYYGAGMLSFKIKLVEAITSLIEECNQIAIDKNNQQIQNEISDINRILNRENIRKIISSSLVRNNESSDEFKIAQALEHVLHRLEIIELVISKEKKE